MNIWLDLNTAAPMRKFIVLLSVLNIFLFSGKCSRKFHIFVSTKCSQRAIMPEHYLQVSYNMLYKVHELDLVGIRMYVNACAVCLWKYADHVCMVVLFGIKQH